MLIIPKKLDAVDDRKIGYKLLWQEKSKRKSINFSELDESEIEEIKEFELDVIKGESYISELMLDIKDVIDAYDVLNEKDIEGLKIRSFYINEDSSLDTKGEESYWILKSKI